MMPSTESGLAARVEQLTEERDYYRRELGLVTKIGRVAWMQSKFKMTALEARVCEVLLEQPDGRTISRETIFAGAWDHPEDIEIKIVDVIICKIRAKIGFDAIETVYATGRRLTPAGRALLSGAGA